MPSDSSSRILVLSDLHLGRRGNPVTTAECLRPVWQGCSRLILNGDTAEIHHAAHRVDAARRALAILEAAERDGVEVVLLSGNHDPMISDHRHVELAGGQVFITHGDVFHPAVAPWSPRAPIMRREFDKAMRAVRGTTASELEARLKASQHASRFEWEHRAERVRHSTIWRMMLRPWVFPQVLWYWYRFPRLAARFAEEHALAARHLVFGHTHRPGIYRIGERVIINTGSFTFPGRPLAVSIEPDALRVYSVPRSRGVFRLSDSPLGTFPLEPTTDESAHACDASALAARRTYSRIDQSSSDSVASKTIRRS